MNIWARLSEDEARRLMQLRRIDHMTNLERVECEMLSMKLWGLIPSIDQPAYRDALEGRFTFINEYCGQAD